MLHLFKKRATRPRDLDEMLNPSTLVQICAGGVPAVPCDALDLAASCPAVEKIAAQLINQARPPILATVAGDRRGGVVVALFVPAGGWH